MSDPLTAMTGTAASQTAIALREVEETTALLIDLLKLASLINTPMREAVADPLEMTPTELKIVLALGGEGELAGHDLSEMMGMAPMNVSRAIAGLIERGWVEPGNDLSNRRRKPVRLSAQGMAAFERTMPAMARVGAELFAGLGQKERATFHEAAQSILSRMSPWNGEVS